MTIIHPRDHISVTQLVLLISTTITTIGFLDILEIAKDIAIDTWIPVLFAIIIVPFFIVTHIKLAEQFPDENIIAYTPKIVGKWLGYPIAFFLSSIYFFLSLFIFQIFLEIIKVFLLPKTPKEIVIIIQAVVLLYAVWFGLNGIARLAELMIPILTLLFTLLLFLIFLKADYTNILPIANNGLLPIVKNIYKAVPLYAGLGCITMLYPFLNRKKKIGKPIFFTVIGTGIIIFFLILLTMLTFRYEVTDLYFPSISLFQRFTVSISFIERIVFFLLMIVIPIFFIFSVITYFLSVIGFTTIFKFREHTVFSILLIPAFFLISNIPISIADIFWLKGVPIWTIDIALLVPAVLLIILKLKERKK